jgi:hypothetical protein
MILMMCVVGATQVVVIRNNESLGVEVFNSNNGIWNYLKQSQEKGPKNENKKHTLHSE